MHSVEIVFLMPGKLHDLDIQSTHVLVSHICEWERGRMYLKSVASKLGVACQIRENFQVVVQYFTSLP